MDTHRKILAVLGALAVACLSASMSNAQTAAPGYVVIEFKVKDADGFKNYSRQAPATVSQYGGNFTIRPGKVDVLKGDPPNGPFAIISFASVEQAKKWASSPEYRALVPLRDQAADTRAFIVEGVAP